TFTFVWISPASCGGREPTGRGEIPRRAGLCAPRAVLADAKRIAFGIPHDREPEVRPLLRLDDGCAGLREPLDLGFPVVGREVEVDRIRLGPRLFAALEEEAWPPAVRRSGDVEGTSLALVHAGVEKLPHKALVDLFFGPVKGECPEPAELARLRAGKRHVADVTVRQRVRRALDAKAVALRVAHHRPRLGEIADRGRLPLDEPAAELEDSP